MFMILFLVAVLAISVYVLISNRANYVANIPGPSPWPVIGNALEFLNIGPVETFKKLMKYNELYGQTIKMQFGSKYWYLHSKPEDVEAITTSVQFNNKSEDYDQVGEWLGTGLLISSGNKWFTHRKALTPAFHFKILENFVNIFDEQSDILVKKLTDAGETIDDIFPFVKHYALDVLCETAMGTSCNAQTTKSTYTDAVEEISSILSWRMYNILGHLKWGFWLTNKYKPFHELVKQLQAFTTSIVEKRRAEMIAENDKKIETVADEVLGTKRKMALLDILLQVTIDDKPLTDEEIREEVDNFMFAGHDTTTSALTFLLYNLAKYQEVQQKVFEEIQDVIGNDKSSKISLHTLNDLKYLDSVIKESLRMFPPVPFIARRTQKEVELAGHVFPAGTNVSIGIYFMHHNPKYFPEPEEFKPERFDVDREANCLNPFAYIPFSAGSRNCIGQKFAVYEIKSVISKIIRHFKIELPEEGYQPILKAEIILKPAAAMAMEFHPR